MPKWPIFPIVYEINTKAWLNGLSSDERHPVTLGSVPETELKRLAGYGFDALWLMGVWQRSSCARNIAREHPGLQTEYHRALSDFTPEDVVGSPYVIYNYRVDPTLGGDKELNALRRQLRKLGLLLILDFGADFRYDENYFASLFDLILTIYAIPLNLPAILELREQLRVEPRSRPP